MLTKSVVGVLLVSTLFIIVECAKKETAPKSTGLGRGLGDDIDWVEWPKAISTALDVDKPIFLLIHKTWCGACTALKKSFQTSSKRKELIELSKQFVMVNTEDDEEPEEEEFAPDGRYIPRLYFLDKSGELLDVNNKKNYANNAYYFPQVPDVIRGMKEALKLYAKQKKSDEKTKSEEAKVEKEDEGEKLAKSTQTKALKEEKEKKLAEKAEKMKKVEEKKQPKEQKMNTQKVEASIDLKTSQKLLNEELNEEQEVPETVKAEKTNKAKSEKSEAGGNVVEKADEESLGEMYLSDEDLDIMETGGCPHAAAARAAARAAEKESKEGEKGKEEASKKEKSQSKETEEKREEAKKGKKTEL